MKKDIKQFVDELADYINRFIAGRDGSYIKRCRPERLQLNRGHAIPLEVQVPEEYHGRFSDLGPTFYAEELLEEFPNATVACIAENINVRMNEHYPEFLRIMEMSAQMEDNSIDDYKDDIIISTLPIQEFSDMNGKETDFIIKRLDDIGIIMSIKGRLFNSQLDRDQSFFVPILKKNGREVTEDDWKRAETNCLRHSEIDIAAIPTGGPKDACESEVICGTAVEANRFYDYFYLVSPKFVWNAVCVSTGAKKVYIAPDGAYQAVFVADNPKADKDVMAAILDEMFFDEEEERQSTLPILVYDYETSTLKKFEREGWHL